ncbi:MAG TPA: AAA family ATPase [Selenomonas sp.]|nr:AAA family ATPase [Selenomonas sp.]
MFIAGRKCKDYPPDTIALELAREYSSHVPDKLAAVMLDNELHDLQTPIGNHEQIDFVGLDSEIGWRIYRRSVIFLLITAVKELYPEAEVTVKFRINKGLFCEVNSAAFNLDEGKVREIEAAMRCIVEEGRPIVKERLSRERAVRLFKESKQIEKANLISALRRETVNIYRCGGFYDYLYGAMMGNTGDLGEFAVDYHKPGLLLITPDITSGGQVPVMVHQPKLGNILSEAKRWAGILKCDYVPDLNRANRHGRIGDIIRVSEALQEKKIAQIADHIAAHGRELRLIIIAGPSSSGKTSFAQRLRIQLRVNGLEPISISLDDYYRNREDCPRNARGEYDFECLEALDVELFNEHMLALLSGKHIVPPRFNFVTGMREMEGQHPFAIRPDQPIIIEGIHGLNEKLTEAIPRHSKYKIYISALTQLNIDSHNRIATTDARLIRRIVRDYQFRGAQALRNLRMWPVVREGEERYLFPFQEEADVMFNSALIYELGILKRYVEPLLEKIPPEQPEYTKARRLLDICQYFEPITAEDEVPNNSILREFIGKSCFFA